MKSPKLRAGVGGDHRSTSRSSRSITIRRPSTYAELLETFWRNIDPFDANGQFCDKGPQYRSAVFAGTAEERQLGQSTKDEVAARLGKPVSTEILPAQTFYAAEDYHQNFHVTNSARYKFYKFGCGRAQASGGDLGEAGSMT